MRLTGIYSDTTYTKPQGHLRYPILISVALACTMGFSSVVIAQHKPMISPCSPTTMKDAACQAYLMRVSAKYPLSREEQAKLARVKALGHQLVAEEKAKIDAQQQHAQAPQTGRGLPNVSLASPNAFGGKGTSVFAGLTYVNHWNGTTVSDGSGTVGVAFGDPFKYIGASINVAIDSLGLRKNNSFASNGSAGFRLNRYLTRTTAIAVGAGNPGGWGAQRKLATSYYGDITQGINCRFPITLNFGTGTGAFYSAASAQAKRDDQLGIFGGVGVTVLPGLSLIVDDASRELNTGATYIFNYKKLGFFLTAAGMNVARYKNFQPHFMASGGVSYQLSS